MGTSQHTDVIPFQAPLSYLASLKPWELSARTWEELTRPGATLHHGVGAGGGWELVGNCLSLLSTGGDSPWLLRRLAVR